ncbi:MAG TPA: ABC transporter permease [Chryseolinea sp.]
MNRRPSHRAMRFLKWFCPPPLHEGIEGDLLEQFELDCKAFGEKKARRLLIWNVLKFFRLSILRRNKYSIGPNQAIMISNYAKVASRNIMKRKSYSFINAFGLSIGIAFCVLIYLYIRDERSFDRFHANKDHIYRMESKTFNTYEKDPEPFSVHAWLQLGLKQVLLDELPQVERATRFSPDYSAIFRYGDKSFTEKVAFVDADFFQMFSFPLLKGSKESLFKNTADMVLTPAIAEKYFGVEDPIGKSISLNTGDGVEKLFTVAGIIETPPANSSLDFAILVPQENRPGYARNITRWQNWNTPTFVQLRQDADLKTFAKNLDAIVEKYLGEAMKTWRKEAVVNIPPDVKLAEYLFTPLPDIHLKKEISWTKVSDPQYSYILIGIAVLILAIACINYISLALTTSASRRTEVGIRKVVGAQKNQLVYQFGLESVLLAMCSLLLGLLLVMLFLPYFNTFTGKEIRVTYDGLAELALYSVGLALLVGLTAGSYPAFFLSAFRPALALKRQFTSRLAGGFTKPLVVLQFALSAFLIISALIMYRQMRYIAYKDLGFDKERVVIIPTQMGWRKESDKVLERFRNRLKKEPSVISVAGTSNTINRGYNIHQYKVKGGYKSAYIFGADPEYIPTMGIQLVQGRNFDERIPEDSNAVIVNEALVREMNWKEPLNEYLNWLDDSLGVGSKVIGVTKDYHFRSLEAEIKPMLLSMNREHAGYLYTMLVKLAPGDMRESIEMLRRAWNDISPSMPFDYSFLEEDVAAQYASYDRWMSIMGFSTGFAILISSLGLFGLSGINAVNRTKEIGIRKVMGAEMMNIFVLLNRQYVWLAIIAFAFAAPVSWYVMDLWLSDFKFAITIGWELFALSMAVGLLIALLTVSYHAIRTALINPAQTLKYE